jgi:hypothetical protein
VLEAQPPAQPHRRVSIERPIRLADGAYRKVVRPSAQRAGIDAVEQASIFKDLVTGTYDGGGGAAAEWRLWVVAPKTEKAGA